MSLYFYTIISGLNLYSLFFGFIFSTQASARFIDSHPRALWDAKSGSFSFHYLREHLNAPTLLLLTTGITKHMSSCDDIMILWEKTSHLPHSGIQIKTKLFKQYRFLVSNHHNDWDNVQTVLDFLVQRNQHQHAAGLVVVQKPIPPCAAKSFTVNGVGLQSNAEEV